MSNLYGANISEAIRIALRSEESVNAEAARRRERFLQDTNELICVQEYEDEVRVSFDAQRMQELDERYEYEENIRKMQEVISRLMEACFDPLVEVFAKISVDKGEYSNLNTEQGNSVSFQKEKTITHNEQAVIGDVYKNAA